MSNLSDLTERLQRVFEPTPRGVVGLVEDLLGLCREQGLQFDWNTNQCQVRPLGAGPQETTEVPLQKSVFRAMLARLAALCNERTPDSVSPYGGEGELSVGTNPPTIFRVVFANAPGEQRLQVNCPGDDNEKRETGNGQEEPAQLKMTHSDNGTEAFIFSDDPDRKR